MKNENQKVPHEGMEAIWNVACVTWKKKIEKMTSVFGDTELTNEQVQEMYNAASSDQKKVLQKWIQLPKSKIDSITCFKDIEAALGEKVILPYTNPKTKEERQLNATVKGFAIAKVFNEGKILTWENREDYKYFPYKYFSGGSWVWCSDYWGRGGGSVPVGLCFKNSDLSIKAYTLFPEIYEDILMFEKV